LTVPMPSKKDHSASTASPLVPASPVVAPTSVAPKVALLPATTLTRDLFDADRFARLAPGTTFVNLGRGTQVVERDLLDALDRGHLAGAVLDVFRDEPLPADHPFWRHPRVLVTPHVAGSTLPHTGAVAVADNIRRVRAGLPLRHVVSPERGY